MQIAFEHIAEDAPSVIAHLNEIIRQRLRRNQLILVLTDLFGQIDDTTLYTIEQRLEWHFLKGGERLSQQGDPSDSFYLLITGRLKAFVEDLAGNLTVAGEITRGECGGPRAVGAFVSGWRLESTGTHPAKPMITSTPAPRHRA